MSRILALLCLLVALTATPLRQAEAASDLARCLDGASEPAALEAPDGGVGDDSGDGTWNGSGPQFPIPRVPAIDAFPALPTHLGSSIDIRWRESGRARPWRPTEPPRLRRAWLQILVI